MKKHKLKELRHLPTRIKDNSCRNCGYDFEEEVNYCPRCGQVNNIRRITFLDFIRESLGDFFAYDSRLFNSIVPLFTKPGKISRDYISGKKDYHIHPVRLYFIASFTFFFVSSITNWKEEKFSENDQIEEKTIIGDLKIDENTSRTVFEGLFGIDKEDSIDQTLIDSARYNSVKLSKLLILLQRDSISQSRDSIFKKYDIEPSLKNRFIYSKVKNSYNLSWQDVLESYYDKFPIVAFFFLPFFVMFLNILHYSKDILYFEHIIFAFHIQAVFFITLTLLEIASAFLPEISDGATIWILLAFAIYLLIALKTFYEYKTWFKSIFMWFVLNAIYFTLALFIFLISITFFFVIV